MKLPRLFIILVAFLFIGLASPTTASGNEDSDKTPSAKSPGPSEASPYRGWRPPEAFDAWEKGAALDKEEDEEEARLKHPYEDEVANLWRRFLLYECWKKLQDPSELSLWEFDKQGKRVFKTSSPFVKPYAELEDIERPEDNAYKIWEAHHLEWAKDHPKAVLAPAGEGTSKRKWGSVYDCECGGLRHWIWVDREYYPRDRHEKWPEVPKFKDWFKGIEYWPKDSERESDVGPVKESWQAEDDHFRGAIADPAVDWRNFEQEWSIWNHWRSLRRGYYTIPLKDIDYCLYPRFNESER